MILLLLEFDELLNNVLEQSNLSDEVLGLSERGDLISSPRGCLARDALIDNGMHIDRPDVEVDSLSSAALNCSDDLREKTSNFSEMRSCCPRYSQTIETIKLKH